MNPQVIVLGIDLFALGKVNDVLDVEEKRTFRKSKLITNTFNIPVDNIDNYFSVDSPDSIFHGTKWRYSSVLIYNSDGNKIWEGVIVDIERNHIDKTAVIVCKNTFFAYRNQIIVYQSSDWESGAEAFQNICDSIEFEKYNSKSVADSDAQLLENNCKLQCDFTEADGVTFMQAIEKLAEYSNADLYVHNDELYFVHWQPFTGGVKVVIDGNKKGVLKKAPLVSTPEKDIINDYSIDWYESGKVPATDSNSNNIGILSRAKFGTFKLPEFRTGSNAQIVFMDKISASYIGDGYIKKTNRNYDTDPEPPRKIEISLFSDNEDWINLQTHFKFDFAEEGWVEEPFGTYEFIVNEEEDELKIVGYGE